MQQLTIAVANGMTISQTIALSTVVIHIGTNFTRFSVARNHLAVPPCDS